MRIVVHDYVGHAFPIQLSRELARRGHKVLHLHFLDFQTPKGNLRKLEGDAATFDVEGISLGEPFSKWSNLIRRRGQELRYARHAADRLRRFRPEVVLSGQTPLEVQEIIHNTCKEISARLVIWVQDFYCLAVETLLARKLGFFGKLVGQYYRRVERRLLQECDQIIYIAEDFFDRTRGWLVDTDKCHVIENWSPLNEITPCSRNNAWAQRHDLIGKPCLLYSGTLGMKHNPALLLELAESCRDDRRLAVVVVSEGPGRAWLEAQTAERRLSNLKLFDYQPHEQMSEVLGSADILIAMLNADAGSFSVPSKVLSYLCAGRPVVAALPSDNLAAKTVLRARAGLVIEPDDVEGLIDATRRLLADETLRGRLGANGRQYAEEHFSIGKIAERFEAILSDDGKRRASRPSAKLQPQLEQ